MKELQVWLEQLRRACERLRVKGQLPDRLEAALTTATISRDSEQIARLERQVRGHAVTRDWAVIERLDRFHRSNGGDTGGQTSAPTPTEGATVRLESAPDVLTLQEASELARVCKRTIRDAIRTGELPSRRVGRQFRIAKSVFVQWLSGVDLDAD